MIKVNVTVVLSLGGGHSTTAMQVTSHCRSQNISIRVAEILQLGTVRLIAQAGKSVLQEQCPGYQPLHPSYIVKLERHTTHQDFVSTLLSLINRHSMLRARFPKRTDAPIWEHHDALQIERWIPPRRGVR